MCSVRSQCSTLQVAPGDLTPQDKTSIPKSVAPSAQKNDSSNTICRSGLLFVWFTANKLRNACFGAHTINCLAANSTEAQFHAKLRRSSTVLYSTLAAQETQVYDPIVRHDAGQLPNEYRRADEERTRRPSPSATHQIRKDTREVISTTQNIVVYYLKIPNPCISAPCAVQVC